MDFVGTGKSRSPGGIAAAAASIGVETAALWAVIDVEAAGKGFDSRNRPKMLFEPHKFYAELEDRPAQQKAAVKAGIAFKVRKKQYPADSYPRLLKAIAIDLLGAVRSASWGAGQIMGFNAKTAGYRDAVAMVEDFKLGEDEQIMAMARFIKSNRSMLNALKAKNWARFAELYNGPSYADNRYDVKLAQRYAARKRQAAAEEAKVKAPKMPDDGTPIPIDVTPRPPVLLPSDPDKPVELETALTKEEIESLQQILKDKGYDPGGIDGKIGSRTIGAIASFQAENSLPITSTFDAATRLALPTAPSRPIPEARQKLDAQDLRNAGSATVKKADDVSFWGKVMGWLGLGGAGYKTADETGALNQIQQFVDQGQQAQTIFSAVGDIGRWALDNWWMFAIVIGAYAIWKSREIIKARVQQVREGASTEV